MGVRNPSRNPRDISRSWTLVGCSVFVSFVFPTPIKNGMNEDKVSGAGGTGD